MRSKLALAAAAAAALLAACAQSPTASPARTSAPRYDGGTTLGGGAFKPDTTSSTQSTEVAPGGNGFGSGH